MQLKICFGIVHCLKFPNGTNSAFDGKYRKYKHSKTENLSLSQKREMVLTDVTTVKYDEWGEI